MSLLDQFRKQFGLQPKQKVISSRGRTAQIFGADMGPSGQIRNIWLMVDNTPGTITVPIENFRKTPPNGD